LFLSLRTKSNARAQFQLDFFSPATKLFALLGGASKQHSLTGLDFWEDFLWRKSWRLFMAELERQSVFGVCVVLSICGGLWSLCARKARKRERNLRMKDQKLQARNGTERLRVEDKQ